MTTETEPALPIGDAARMLNVSIDTLRTWESKGKISAIRTGGNQRRFPLSEIERVREATR